MKTLPAGRVSSTTTENERRPNFPLESVVVGSSLSGHRGGGGGKRKANSPAATAGREGEVKPKGKETPTKPATSEAEKSECT